MDKSDLRIQISNMDSNTFDLVPKEKRRPTDVQINRTNYVYSSVDSVLYIMKTRKFSLENSAIKLLLFMCTFYWRVCENFSFKENLKKNAVLIRRKNALHCAQRDKWPNAVVRLLCVQSLAAHYGRSSLSFPPTAYRPVYTERDKYDNTNCAININKKKYNV